MATKKNAKVGAGTVFKRRSMAAKRGWITRRAKAEKRSESARQGWDTRRLRKQVREAVKRHKEARKKKRRIRISTEEFVVIAEETS